MKHLSKRQIEILSLITLSLPNKAIASYLKIGIKTVEGHRKRLYKKLNEKGTAGLSRYTLTHQI